MCDHHIQFRRLRHNRGIRRASQQRRSAARPGLDQTLHAGEAVLFIDRTRHDHGWHLRRPGPHQAGEDAEDDRQRAFHVAGTPAVDPPLALQGHKRIDRHPRRSHGVLMDIDQQAGTSIFGGERTVQAANHVIASRFDLLPFHGHAEFLKTLLNEPRQLSLAIRRACRRLPHGIDARYSDQVREQIYIIPIHKSLLPMSKIVPVVTNSSDQRERATSTER